MNPTLTSAAAGAPGAGLLRAFVRKHFSLADLRHLTTLLDSRGWA